MSHGPVKNETFLEKKGFLLMELIPAITLIAAISIVSVKFLSIDLRTRELEWRQELILTTHHEVFHENTLKENEIVLCRLNEDREWEELRFPDGRWIPDQPEGEDWIMWRARLIQQDPHMVIGREYLRPGSAHWIWWNSIVLTGGMDG